MSVWSIRAPRRARSKETRVYRKRANPVSTKMKDVLVRSRIRAQRRQG